MRISEGFLGVFFVFERCYGLFYWVMGRETSSKSVLLGLCLEEEARGGVMLVDLGGRGGGRWPGGRKGALRNFSLLLSKQGDDEEAVIDQGRTSNVVNIHYEKEELEGESLLRSR